MPHPPGGFARCPAADQTYETAYLIVRDGVAEEVCTIPIEPFIYALREDPRIDVFTIGQAPPRHILGGVL